MSLRLAILASHGGSNAQAILDACARREIDAEVTVVVSNNSSAPVLERARRANVDCLHMSAVTHGDALDVAMADEFRRRQVDLVVLAGYMKRLGPETLAGFSGRIVNIHPALLPKHGGRGMYGSRVHQAVLDAGETETGVTVHLVEGEYDHGRHLAQAEVPVMSDDDVETLAARVYPVEHRLYVATIGQIASGEIEL